MANLIRSAKSASNWSKNKLLAYNIFVQPQNALDLFGKELGPIDHLDPNLLSSVDSTDPMPAKNLLLSIWQEVFSKSPVSTSRAKPFARVITFPLSYAEMPTQQRKRMYASFKPT
ncbi:hypothetical protein M378DRAFT_12239 [Amanita muscaria Koide BX008]|uniref:Uncharacterized protein n=1 Tax=Amanita muscaria (strain Koide BX008) TaxID=946122 RepID=A0A0C2T9K8_AMAMK|nr:hypothetical protein M378DRAFT_12239 [Amanita muscaria Koide BX008]